MKNKINLPEFTGVVTANSTNDYYNSFIEVDNYPNQGNSTIYLALARGGPVRRHCGPCRNGKKICLTTGYECTVVPGRRGSEELGIPPSSDYIRCQPAVFRTWQVSC